MGGYITTNARKENQSLYNTETTLLLSSTSAIATKCACMQLSLDSLPCKMASTISGSAMDKIFVDKELFEVHFGFSCVKGVLDSDKFTRDGDDAKGNSYSSKKYEDHCKLAEL